MHRTGGADDGIHRTGLNAFCAADAVRFVDHRQHSRRYGFLRIAVRRLRVDVQQFSDFEHHRFAAGRAAVNFLTLSAYGFRVGTTAGANPHMTDKYGKTPLELAREKGFSEIADLLLAAGA